MSEFLPVRVIGCGSPNGDDAVAWEVIRHLRQDHRISPETELHAVEGGHQLLDVLDGRGILMLVDAISSSNEPGSIHRFCWPDDRLATLRPGTTHHMRPAEALQLAETLGMLPQRVIFFGVEAACMDVGSGISQPVTQAIPQVVDRIVEELNVVTPPK